MTAWRIDSLDARAGLAFASWREADLMSPSPELDQPAVFLSPPSFRPEALASRAMGFAAARGRAQFGVYLEGAELAFETLEALTEFVRRAYLAGGGGDAAGGGGAGPPREPEGGPEFPREPDRGREREGGPAGRSLLGAAYRARKIADGLRFTASQAMPSEAFGAAAAAREEGPGPGADLLADGASELILEFLRRLPAKRSARGNRAWFEGAERLGAAIGRLGLWPEILGGAYRSDLYAAFNAVRLSTSSDVAPTLEFLPDLFGSGWALAYLPLEPTPDAEFYSLRELGRPFMDRIRPGADPVDDLASWPLPKDVAALAGAGKPDRTAFHLMSAVSAEPGRLADANWRPAAAAAAILAFSAGHIIAEAAPPTLGSWLTPDVRKAGLEEFTDRALAWLFGQWPTVLFPLPVEALIGETALLPAA